MKEFNLIVHAAAVTCALASIFMRSAYSADSTPVTDEASLSWVPPSTSYLPFYQGPLTEKDGQGPNTKEKKELSPAEVQESRHTVAARFDELRAKVLGEKDPLAPILESQLYVSGLMEIILKGWQGSCDQWSAWTDGDPQLVKYLDQAGDLSCQGVYLAKAEIRELVTAFYPSNSDVDKDGKLLSFGIRYRESLDTRISLARDTLGLDPLSVMDFDQIVIGNLKKNHGVVLSIHAPPQIWNYPVFAIKTETTEIDPSELGTIPALSAESFKLLQPGPAVGSSEAAKILATYHWVHEALDTYIYTVDGSEKSDDPNVPLFVPAGVAQTQKDRDYRIQMTYQGLQELGIPTAQYKSLFGVDVNKLVAIHQMLYQKILQKIQAGEIGLDPSLHIHKKKMQLWHSTESHFAERLAQPNTEMRKFEYALVVSDKDPSMNRGLWMTASENRPMLMWVPKSAAVPGDTQAPYAGVVPDWLSGGTNSADAKFKTYSPLDALYRILQSCQSSSGSKL
jgi:hypothetical protein